MKHVTFILFILFALLSVGETQLGLFAPYRVPSESDWKAAAAAVRAGYQAGDLIVFAPTWSDQVGRSYLGDLVTLEMAGRADEDRYGRIWEVAVRGARAPETKGTKLESENAYGRVQVALYRKAPPVKVTYDFTAQLAQARLTQVLPGGAGNEVPCYVNPLDHDDGFQCASTHVGRRTLEIDYRPHRGILAPVDGQRTTRLEFDAAPLGKTLIGYTGMHDYFSRKNAQGTVHFTVFVDDQPMVSLDQGNEPGWQRFTIDTARWAGQTRRVRFEISAPAPAWRTFGFHAEARRQ